MKKSIVFAVILMFLTIAVLPTGESAGVTITLTDWEDWNLGLTSGTANESGGYFDMEHISGGQPIVSNGWDSPNKAIFLDVSDSSTLDACYLKLVSPISYIGFISLHTKSIESGGMLSKYWNFDFYDSDDDLRLSLRHEVGSYIWETKQSDDSWDSFSCSSSYGHEGWINITHISGNVMNYSFFNSDGTLRDYIVTGTCTTDDWESFSYIKVYDKAYSTSGTYVLYLDEIIISTEQKGTKDICEYRYMTDRYGYVGNVNSYCARQSNEVTIETRYNVPVSLNLTGIDLCVTTEQYSDDDDLNNYRLTINNFPMLSPVCFFKYSTDYILRWIVDVELTNQIPILEFSHYKETYSGRNWQVVASCNNMVDLDNDGEVHYKETTEPDGKYNGRITYSDLAYQMYYEDIHFPDDEDYYENDYISVINETHYCGEATWLTYLLTTLESDSYVRVWNDDTSMEVDDAMFPYKCPSTSESIGFIAETNANYTAKLYRNSVELDNVSFYVNDFRNPSNYVYTMPFPSFEGESYYVKFAYDNADNYDGAIFLSNTPDYRNYFEIHYVFDGESGSYIQVQNAPVTLFYILASEKNGTYYVVNNGIHKHVVKSKSMLNYFTLGATHLSLSDGETRQSISGETTHLAGNCKIYDNNKLVYVIEESPFYEFYKVTTSGNHKVEMRLVTNETIILHTLNYTVSGEEDIVPEVSISETIVNWIKEQWGDLGIMITAFAIAIGVMLIPLIIQIKSSQLNANVTFPWIVYVIFGIMGVLVDVYIGLLPVYTILLLSIVGIASGIGIYYSRT